MVTASEPSVSFEETDTRHDEMHSTIEAWIDELVDDVDEAQASEEFQEWLNVQSRFHDYSHRNTLLIKLQCPEATKVAGYNTWRNEFDRHVQEGEQAIWIWAPIIAKCCPSCENSKSYHEQSDCDYDDMEPDEWSKGLVGFRPAPVFDVSQTEGEPLPELETAATGDASNLVRAILEAAETLDIDARLVPEEFWPRDDVKGFCKPQPNKGQPRVEALATDSDAEIAGVLIHEYAHALLHIAVDDTTERSKREVEAEAVAYVVGRHFGLDTSNSAFYLAAWQGEDTETLEKRLGRISRTASELIDAIDEGVSRRSD